MKSLRCKLTASHPLIVLEQSRNLVVSSSRKSLSHVKKLFLKTMFDGLILAPQDGAFFEILQLDHFSK